MRSIYFDYNATTPLEPAVRGAMLPYLDSMYGNPSSIHHIGRKARAALDDARDSLAQVLKSKPSEVVFTSGGTESNNLAIFGVTRLLRAKGKHIITSSIEHHSVLHAFQYLQKKEGYDVTWLPVNSEGIVNPHEAAKAIRPETVLVSVMAGNNETGALQPVSEIGRVCQQKGVLFHTDASQYFGKEPFDNIHQFNADLVTFCAHKLYGPKGAGALFIKSPLLPDPLIFGGGHENERRAGTENLAAIIGLVDVAERFVKTPVFPKDTLFALTAELSVELQKIPGVQQAGPARQRLANTLSLTVEGCDSISLIAALDLEGICASSGSACTAGSLEPSHVLKAMGVRHDLANSFVRFSLGRESTAEEVRIVCNIFPAIVARIRGGA